MRLYWDPTYILIVIALILTAGASALMKSTFAKYERVPAKSHLTGSQTARRILSAAGIADVGVSHIPGNLTDHYDPRSKMISLSSPVFDQTSLAAVCVAAHECGHAVQDHENYFFLDLRSSIVPIVGIGANLSWPLFFLGIILSIRPLAMIGIVLFSLAVLFQLVTLPVEINASRRALAMLQDLKILEESEISGGRAVLGAAALTYVAGLASSVLQLLRMVMILGGRRRD